MEKLDDGKKGKAPMLDDSKMDKMPLPMLDDRKMDTTPPLKPYNNPLIIPEKHFEIFDPRNTFAASINISAKKLHKLCRLKEEQKLSRQFDVLNVLLSNSGIKISSLVNFPALKMKVLMPTTEPISFGIHHRTFMRGLRVMMVGKEIHRIVLAYRAEENLLIIVDGVTEIFIKTDSHLYRKRNKQVASAS